MTSAVAVLPPTPRDEHVTTLSNLMVATAKNVEAMADEYITQQCGPRQAAAALAAATLPHAPEGTLVRAVQLALAHVMGNRTGTPGELAKLVRLRGNIKDYYDDDMDKLAASSWNTPKPR